MRDWYKHGERSLTGHDRIRQFVVNKVNSADKVSQFLTDCLCPSYLLFVFFMYRVQENKIM